MEALTTVSDLPLTSGDRGNAGFGSIFAHVPLWMWVGCDAPAGAPVTARTTLVCVSLCFVSVAVPDSPELLWGDSLASMDPPPIPSVLQPASKVTAQRTGTTVRARRICTSDDCEEQ